jgi:hypothetical protein
MAGAASPSGVSGGQSVAPEQQSGDGSGPLVFGLIGVVVVLGLGGLAAFLLFRRRRTTAEASPPPAG